MTVSRTSDIDFHELRNLLNDFCRDCDLFNTGQCKEATCLIGFAKKVINFAEQKGVLDIPGASNLIPKNDFKPYYQDQISRAIAASCKLCRECRDNHSSDCVVSLVRTSLESAVLQEQIDYPGSVFMYLAKVKQQNDELSGQIANHLTGKKTP
ncbi:hypothetical protein [Desulforamulus hydrothermalis]|uniref:Uncharacterized protein n=1 Tax=Desulforamulus hydrothermalis Lam5 = DSM 18033 TaxID=1121428 RepID=K8E057_9FIRM|nr:hypothetical protein [Desulforamulus hydrothermalis]CCO08790.1 conserved hypothetical protein [Desulforamulus hydrothermalis Lam5 = DSM 18033]SHG71588.1 hypothetical protein SAMN02745177_00102 [Desulforamulus hydrothermalis Lam5 = DSM 18033]